MYQGITLCLCDGESAQSLYSCQKPWSSILRDGDTRCCAVDDDGKSGITHTARLVRRRRHPYNRVVAARMIGEQRFGRRFKLRQRMFALGEHYDVENERGEPSYQINGKALRVQAALQFCDLQGQVIYQIRERFLRVRDTIQISRAGVAVARVHNALFSPLYHRSQIERPGSQDLLASGNFLYHEYRLEQNGTVVAVVSKQWLTASESYGVEVADSEDALLMLAIAVVIDTMSHEGM